jgi:hypothetical protein
VAADNSGPIAMLVATPKRGGALKCAPLACIVDDSSVLSKLLDAATNRAFPGAVFRKLYSHVPLLDGWLIEELKHLGFSAEGVLREPYLPGVDMIVMSDLRF